MLNNFNEFEKCYNPKKISIKSDNKFKYKVNTIQEITKLQNELDHKNIILKKISNDLRNIFDNNSDNISDDITEFNISNSIQEIKDKFYNIDNCSKKLWETISGEDCNHIPDINTRIDIAIKFICLLKDELKKCGYENVYLDDNSNKSDEYIKLENECNELKQKILLLENQMKNRIISYVDIMTELLQCVDLNNLDNSNNFN